MHALLENFGTALATTYRAERLRDGRIAVRDVPIYSESFPTDPRVQAGAGVARDKAWLERALAKYQARARGGYFPPMNLRHFMANPEAVGTFTLEGLRPVSVNPGEPPRWTFFGSLIFGDERLSGQEALERAKGYPFRSIEVSPDAPDEVDCLALLRESAPANKYPNLKIEAFSSRLGQVWGGNECFQVSTAPLQAREINMAPGQPRADNGEWSVGGGSGGSPPTAKPATGPVSPHQGSFGKDKKGRQTFTPHPEAVARIKAERDAMAKKRHGEQSESRSEDMHDENEAGGQAPAPAAPGAAAAAPADPFAGAPAWAKELHAMAKACYEAVSKMAQPAAQPAAETPAAAAAPSDPAPAVFSARPDTGVEKDGKIIPLNEAFASRLEVAGLRAALDKLNREKEAGALTDSAAAALTDLGMPVNAEYRKELFSTALDGGKKAIDTHLAAIRRAVGAGSGGLQPFGALDGGAGRRGDPEPLKKALETFGNRPGSQDAIRELYAAWDSDPRMKRIAPDFFRLVSNQPDLNLNGGRV